MVSDFRKKKLLHVFNVFFDVNKSGSIDKKDFEDTIEKVKGIKGVNPSEAKETLFKIWDLLQASGDSDKDGQVSADEWVSLWEAYAKNPSSPAEWQTLYAKFIFNLEDASNDGSIDVDEFSTVYSAFGLNQDESKAAFQKMAKGKSSVSWSEFQELWKEYFSSDDSNAPGNFIFGKASF